MRLLSGSNGSDWPGVVVSGTTATFEQAEATDKRVDRPWLPADTTSRKVPTLASLGKFASGIKATPSANQTDRDDLDDLVDRYVVTSVVTSTSGPQRDATDAGS